MARDTGAKAGLRHEREAKTRRVWVRLTEGEHRMFTALALHFFPDESRNGDPAIAHAIREAGKIGGLALIERGASLLEAVGGIEGSDYGEASSSLKAEQACRRWRKEVGRRRARKLGGSPCQGADEGKGEGCGKRLRLQKWRGGAGRAQPPRRDPKP